MNASFLRIKATDEWYTPLELIQALGEFDLYYCCPIKLNNIKNAWLDR